MSEYIKREDALHELSTSDFLKDVPDFERGIARARARLVINAIPAADVEPVVRAHWEREFKEVPVRDGSRCVMKVLYKCAGENGCKKYSSINSNRCPDCGAHMERSGSGE